MKIKYVLFKDKKYPFVASAHSVNGGEYYVGLDLENGGFILLPADSKSVSIEMFEVEGGQ